MVSDLLRMEIFECIAAVAQPIHDFGDEFMSNEINALCDRLVKHLKG